MTDNDRTELRCLLGVLCSDRIRKDLCHADMCDGCPVQDVRGMTGNNKTDRS